MCKPGAMPWRLQASRIVSMAFTSVGCSNCPGTPSEIERSEGPIMMASKPGVESSSSRLSTASRDSICMTTSVFEFMCSITCGKVTLS